MTHITPSTPVLKRKYFSFEERRYLERLRQQNVGIRECARILVRSHSVILRELARAPAYDRYRAEYAQRVALRAQSNKGNVGKLTSNASLRSAVVEGILRDSSPEQISARIGRMGEAFGVQGRVSTETIYQFLYRDPLAREQKLYLHLRRSRAHRRSTKGRRKQRVLSRIAHRESIHVRPLYIEHRKEFGHLETDSVIFSTGRDILSVQYERMVSLARLTKLPDKTAASTASALQ
jgi:transposase, IS30 family